MKICVLPGDGIGPEITTEAVRVLSALDLKFDMEEALLGGAALMAFVVVVAYEGTVVAYRTGLDPDTYGIPIVSSSVDFVGALTLILTIAILGIV